MTYTILIHDDDEKLPRYAVYELLGNSVVETHGVWWEDTNQHIRGMKEFMHKDDLITLLAVFEWLESGGNE